ncbi:hypothetical protein PPERSA_00365 [Pseudocohnilembus persalinus]|uniref:Uncharacterized protein n=1 Tax=Pseudocohnilembus persalinus TaxID=266149 RepID=A0A0V0QZ84_PSEPJ|nr:hypothetical protein PPERSA_00365 [Pseudocohnilembus persalinus]|eukprot:KRX07208.1 hypothetical protein PPERSA_00365 [Pseudocohnilembus persalinus]
MREINKQELKYQENIYKGQNLDQFQKFKVDLYFEFYEISSLSREFQLYCDDKIIEANLIAQFQFGQFLGAIAGILIDLNGKYVENLYISLYLREDIFLCSECIAQKSFLFQENKKLISLKQIFGRKEEEIDNWPFIQNEEIYENLRNFIFKENFHYSDQDRQKNHQILAEIEKYYEQKIQDVCKFLRCQKQEKIEYFENLFKYQEKFTDIYKFKEIYDIKKVKNSIENYDQENEINKQQFIQNMREMNSKFYSEHQLQTIFQNLEQCKQEVESNLQQIKNNFEKQYSRFKKNFDNQLKFQPCSFKHSQQLTKISQDQKQITFDYYTNENDENDANNIVIKSEILKKNATYHLKMNINNSDINNNMLLSITTGIKSQNIQGLYLQQNARYLDIMREYDGELNNNVELKQYGQKLFEFLDKNIVLNFVFNIDKKFFRVFDDDYRFLAVAEDMSSNFLQNPVLSFEVCYQEPFELSFNIIDLQIFE